MLKLIACASLMGLVVSAGGNKAAAGSSACIPLTNGSFEEGFKGWEILPHTGFTGLAAAGAETSIMDGTLLLPPMDAHVAVLQCGAHASGPKPDGEQVSSASAQLSLVGGPFIMNARYLTFWTAGGFESLRQGSGTTELELLLKIEGNNGSEIVVPIVHMKPPPFGSCEAGMSILGTFLVDEPRVVDLLEQDGQPTGLDLGESISLSFVLKCVASATTPCDDADMGATLGLDDFQFCPQKPGTVPGDVNGDGVINVDDLLAVINGWGECGACPADIAPAEDPNGSVDVDDLLMVINHWS